MFNLIPELVLSFLRETFSAANDKVTKTLAHQPSMYEETLDHILVCELAATPPRFFAKDRVSVLLETHWLGARWMYERWEIADIAFFVIVRKAGTLVVRKVALLQTKRLYSDELPGTELEDTDYRIGIGRLVDRVERAVPLTNQRAFGFKETSVYGAISAGSEQVQRIDTYMKTRHIPVYYGLYNPPSVPYAGLYPVSSKLARKSTSNDLGCRILPAVDVYDALAKLTPGKSPTFKQLRSKKAKSASASYSQHGWRLEHFVADEVMRCREGQIYEDAQDENLSRLLYARSAPIAAAIAITIDFDENRV
ncbi:MAG: hypothetical protein AB7S71_06410 [Dongiaceae bacterium]